MSIKTAPSVSMKATGLYIDDLQMFAGRALTGRLGSADLKTVAAELDGRFSRYLDRRVPRRERRLAGAFFTGSDLADTMVTPLRQLLAQGPRVFDPACGSGDLLVAAARHLPVRTTFAATLRLWSGLIFGRDLYPELVTVAKARLILLAQKRSGGRGTTSRAMDDWMPSLVPGNGLQAQADFARADVVVMNPPFRLISLPDGTAWGCGRASEAAEFVAQFLAHAQLGATLVAVLPDSIRSGPRYRGLRQTVEEKTQILRVSSHGRLRGADIDVFSLHAERAGGEDPRIVDWKLAVASDSTVFDRFLVSVGPVVPHRHPLSGPDLPYIHARTLPLKGDFREATETRRFAGRTVKPPFVVVRRTSDPRQRRRLTATLILAAAPLAVENHLLVLQPRDGLVGTCRQLLRRLKERSAAEWINQRIRCRHLTVEALGELPWSAS